MTRANLLASMIATPALVAAALLVASETWRLVRPDASWFATAAVDSLADAIASDDLPRAHAFIRAGQAPDDLIAVSHPDLTAGRAVLVSPLVWAVAAGSNNGVLMLLGFGARFERPMDRSAVCLAQRLHRDDIEATLRQHGGAVGEPCPPLTEGEAAPLLAFLADVNE